MNFLVTEYGYIQLSLQINTTRFSDTRYACHNTMLAIKCHERIKEAVSTARTTLEETPPQQ